jgi:hypothetical protein
VSPRIEFAVEDVPPIKRGAESMWGKQLDRVRNLRREAVKQAAGLPPATIEDQAHLAVVVYARPEKGDLDGFVAGICDSLQPCPVNYLPYVRDEDWTELPEAAHPTKALGISDDRAITTIRAERRASEGTRRYEVSLSW